MLSAHLLNAAIGLRRGFLLAGAATLLMAGSAFAQKPLGVDVSYWQGSGGISQAGWDSIAAAGRTFAFVRITHYSIPGTESDAHGDPDPSCPYNVSRARAAGLLVGVYHFGRPSVRDPITEANAFVNYATTYFGANFVSAGYLRPVLDLEDGSSSAHVGATSLTDWCTQWMNSVQSQTGVEPMIYCSGNYASQLNSTMASRTLWFANYTCPSNPQTANPTASISPLSKWTFWQYCSSNAVGTISPIDTDIFNGTAAELQTYVIGGGPPIISSVQATNVTNVAATITWTTDTDSTSQVQYGPTSSYGSSSPLNSTAVTSHSVTITGLSPTMLYHYRVISTNENGTTNSSDYTFTSSGPPSISNVQATNVTGNSATITWTTNAPSDTQVDYGLTSSYGSQSPLNSSLVTSHSVTLTGLLPSTTYHYQALSNNGYGSAQSTDYAFTTPDPSSEVIVDNLDSNCTLTGSWTHSTSSSYHYGADYIFAACVTSTSESRATAIARFTPTLARAGNWDVYIYYSTGSNRSTKSYWKITNAGAVQTYRINQTLQGDGWSLLASDVPFNAGTGGYVEVMNNTGEGTSGGKVIIADAVKFVFKSGGSDTQAPTVPTGLTATPGSATSIQLSWAASTDNIGVSGYKVYRNGSLVGTTATASYSDNGLTANTGYSYTVSAYDAAGNESAQSSPAVSRVTLAVAPSASTVTCDKVAGTWYSTSGFTFTAVGGFGAGTVASYQYAWDTSPSHTWTGGEATWGAGTLALTATTPGSWYLHLKAFNSEGTGGGASDLGIYAFDNSAPLAPVVTDDGAYTTVFDALHATWTASDPQSGIKKYEYRIRIAGGATLVDWTNAGAATSVDATGLSLMPRQTYVFDVRATNNVDLVGPVGSSDGIVVFPYDLDGSGTVDGIDLTVFKSCSVGPNVPFATDQGFDCSPLDADGDGDVDMDDFGAFERCYTGGAIDPACLD